MDKIKYYDGFRPLVWGLLLNWKSIRSKKRRNRKWFSSPGLGTSFKYQ